MSRRKKNVDDSDNSTSGASGTSTAKGNTRLFNVIVMFILLVVFYFTSYFYLKHVTVRRSSESHTHSNEYIVSSFHTAVSDLNNVTYAISLLDSSDKSVIDSIVTSSIRLSSTTGTTVSASSPSIDDVKDIDTIPLLHYCMVLYYKSTSVKTRSSIVTLMLKLLSYDSVSVNTPYKADPSVLVKALILREMKVATSIANRGGLADIDGSLPSIWQLIYQIPCEPVPIAKLLLSVYTHVQSMIANDSRNGHASAGTTYAVDNEMKKLIMTAQLMNQQAPVNGQDLLSSTSFNQILNDLNSTSSGSVRIKLGDVQASLTDMVRSIHSSLLHSIVDTSGVIALVNSLSLVINRKNSRNAFHLLCMAGSVDLIDDLRAVIVNGRYSFDESRLMKKTLSAALQQRDSKGINPITYISHRYGKQSKAYISMEKLCNELEVQCDANIKSSNNSVSSTYNVINTENSSDMGGWDTSNDSNSDTDRCDIEVINHIPDQQEFYTNYVYQSTPVLIRGIALNSKVRRSFNKDNFIASYGHIEVPASVIPYGHTFGYQTIKTTMATIADSNSNNNTTTTATATAIDGTVDETSIGKSKHPPLYVFTTPSSAWHKKLLEDAPIPSFVHSKESPIIIDVETQFYLGSKGTGAPVHFHGAAINILAFGMKKWYIYQPSDAFYTTQSVYESINSNDVNSATNALQCTQKAGDMMYIPALYAHGTMNLQQSIGVAHEISIEKGCME